jgi:hypothetical protein
MRGAIVLMGQSRDHGRQPNERAEKSGSHDEGQGAEAISHVPNLGWGMPIDHQMGKSLPSMNSWWKHAAEASCLPPQPNYRTFPWSAPAESDLSE